jgi:hypothetical protein
VAKNQQEICSKFGKREKFIANSRRPRQTDKAMLRVNEVTTFK